MVEQPEGESAIAAVRRRLPLRSWLLLGAVLGVLSMIASGMAGYFLARQQTVAAALCLLLVLMLCGLLLKGRTLVAAIDELAGAAARFAAGDRDRKVHVAMPPELQRVAAAFNAMIERAAEQERALSVAAHTDGLTGLLNRREFDRELAERVKYGQRYGVGFALVSIDIDYFKRFNDAYGHPGGDAALRTVASRLLDGIRAVDKAFRFGGEEFAAIMPASEAEGARQAAERLRGAIAARHVTLPDGRTAGVTISLGVAVFPADGGAADALVEAADAALNRSKSEGRNRVSMAAPTA